MYAVLKNEHFDPALPHALLYESLHMILQLLLTLYNIQVTVTAADVLFEQSLNTRVRGGLQQEGVNVTTKHTVRETVCLKCQFDVFDKSNCVLNNR